MKLADNILKKLMAQLDKLARSSAVMASPISVGEHHVVPICELAMGYGGGGGGGETITEDSTRSGGQGGGGGGGANVNPLAVLVIEGKSVRLESLAD